MSMPFDLVLVRHGQSEGNVAQHRAEAGDASLYTPEFMARHSSRFRLSDKGREQAKAAGVWLRSNGFDRFDRYFVSEYVRALETAALLDLPEANWQKEYYLREMEYGDFDVYPPDERDRRYAEAMAKRDRDGFFWKPPNGESLADISVRLGRVVDTLHRECADKRVIIVCHGGVMRAFRVRFERMTQEDYNAWEALKDPKERIGNCQIIQYTRRDPETGLVRSSFGWVRSTSPWDAARSWDGWRPIVRKRFSNEELLKELGAAPRIVNG